MIQIIAGEKGKGKTKILIDKANDEIKAVKGNVVYLDKSNKHMYELNNKIRMINVKDYPISNTDEFVGFICGIASSDHDLEKVYLDSFLKIGNISDNSIIESVINRFKEISEQFKVDFIISISVNESDLPDNSKDYIIVSL